MTLKLFSLLFAVIILAACAKPATPAPTSTATPLPATAIPSPSPTSVPGITLTYQDNAQVELVTPAGRHIYIDVFSPSPLTKTPGPDDILLTTHLHSDHYYPDFQENFPGKQLFTEEGQIELTDGTIITGIAAAHNSADPIKAEGSNDYIYIIDVAGLRIAHFGDIGQEALTETQLAALGTVDVAITQFANSFSSMDANNLKGFNLMDQVKPKLIIPTHSDQATIKIAAERWKGYFSSERTITLSKGNLPETESILCLGLLATAYGAIFKLEPWK